MSDRMGSAEILLRVVVTSTTFMQMNSLSKRRYYIPISSRTYPIIQFPSPAAQLFPSLVSLSCPLQEGPCDFAE